MYSIIYSYHTNGHFEVIRNLLIQARICVPNEYIDIISNTSLTLTIKELRLGDVLDGKCWSLSYIYLKKMENLASVEGKG